MLPLFAATLLSAPSSAPAFAPRPFLSRCSMMTALSRATLNFEFPNIPYAAGVHHIHSPEHISETHRLGAPFFKIESVDPPRVTPNKTSISYTCSTLLVKHMRVRMFATQPNESNLLFFKENRALYGVKFTVVPTRAFTSHRLQLDTTMFVEGNSAIKALVKSLLPVALLINGMEDILNYRLDHARENPHFTEYRRAVLRGKGSDEFWIMAERVMRDYSA